MPWMGFYGFVVSALLTVVLMLMSCCPVTCARLGDIYWNSSNPIFRIDNTDHIIDVNKGNIPFEYDQVNIICPVYTPGTREEDVETYIIYNVSKEEYDSCRITNPNSRIIAICDKPHTVRYFTITFRSFTPQPGGLEFIPGQDYYFISTSGGAGEALDQRIGGKCATHNMKVIFKVCCDPAKTTSTPATSTTSTTTTTLAPTVRPSSVVPMMRTTPKYFYRRPTTLTPFRFPPLITSKYPPLKSFDYPREEERSKVSSKKTEDRDKLPNETRAKNEELVNSKDSASRNNSPPCSVIVLLSLIYYAIITR